MGGEMPIPRVQNQSYHARSNRGSGGGIGRGWSEKNYIQRTQSDSAMSMTPNQEHNMTNWYAQVPNLTYKNNFWNKKDHYSRDDKPKAQVTPQLESNFGNDSNKYTEIPNGISVVMCEYERSCSKSTGSKQIEDKPRTPTPPLPAATPRPQANISKAGNQVQQNQQPKHHRPHHNRNSFSRHNNGTGTNRGQQNAHFNSLNPNATNNAGVPNTTKAQKSSNRRPHYRNHSNGSVHRAIRGRFPGPMEPVPEATCLELSDMPEGFQTRFVNMEITEAPRQLFTGSRWDVLSAGIWERFFKTQQKDSTLKKKIYLWQYLWNMVKRSFPQFGLFLVGSTVTGFGCNRSDVDLCLLVRQSHMDQRSEAVVHLEQMLSIVKRCEFIMDATVIQAKVPILRFREFHANIDVDLNCNNCVGIRNSHLLYCYSQLDWRVRPLVLTIKDWARQHNINEAKNMTISSYSLALMVIFFLQRGVNPPILPCLHSMFPGKFNSESDVDRIDIHERLKTDFVSQNQQALGELLHGFFDYYVHFNYDEYAISVRLAEKIPIEVCRLARSYNNDPHQWKHLCIEEPFDLTNTARSMYDPQIFEKVKNVFVQSFNSLEQNYTADSIFTLDLHC